MNRYDIMHRFANKDFGKRGTLKAGNVSCDTKNYYSYSTVFGQWVDMEKDVCIVYQGSTSSSSAKHILGKHYFPEGVHLFPYSTRASYQHYYSGCELVGYYGKFDWNSRKTLISYYVNNIYKQFEEIVGGTKKGLENVSFKDWGYVKELCSLYKDTSVNKWLKEKMEITKKDKLQKRMVKMLKDGERNVEVITDAIFGNGTFKKYWDYCAKYRKSDKTRAHFELLAHYLKLRSPYGRDWGKELVCKSLRVSELKELTAKERLEIKFQNISELERLKTDDARRKKERRNKYNAYKYIVGSKPVIDNTWSYRSLETVINRYTGETYDLKMSHYWSEYPTWRTWSKEFNASEYDSFRKSEDKEQWIRNFYDECKQLSLDMKALNLLIAIEAHTSPQRKYSWRKQYLDDEYLSEKLTGEELAICKDFIRRQDAHLAREIAEERAMEIRRQREEEERKKEEELKKQIKEEQIQKCLNGTDDDKRNLWRLHYMSIDEAEFSTQIPNFYDGGNVLMRFNMDKTLVETSKHIKLDIPTCKRLWKIISIWHNDPSKFREITVKTHYSGSYTISSYENDILTAGCHKIAYAEMERMYNTILENEKRVV